MIRARAVGNAVFVEHPGSSGDVAAWGAPSPEAARSAAAFVNATLEAVLRDVAAEVVARFSPERPPTTNERHLLNLLSWREKEASELRKLLAATDSLASLLLPCRDLLAEFVRQAGEDCRYDHNGFCQEHYSSRPCRVERALAAIALETPQTPS